MSQSKAQKAAAKAAKAVANAYKASLGRGSYSGQPAIVAATKRIESELNAAALDALGGVVMSRAKKPRRKLTAAEKKARARGLSAHRASAARAARLPGKKRRTKKTSKRSKVTSRSAAAPRTSKKTTRRASKTRTVTAAQVVAAAAQKALRRWACEGPRRSGCGAGGSRVVTAKGSFKRLRPLRVMTAGG